MKAAVPPTAKIAKDAKECVQECVSEVRLLFLLRTHPHPNRIEPTQFISFITSEAAEKCHLEKRKTIGGEDILAAMASLGFEDYVECLRVHLAKLRQVSHSRFGFSTRPRYIFVGNLERNDGYEYECDEHEHDHDHDGHEHGSDDTCTVELERANTRAKGGGGRVNHRYERLNAVFGFAHL